MKIKTSTYLPALLLVMYTGAQHAHASNNNDVFLAASHKLNKANSDAYYVGRTKGTLPISPLNFDAIKNGDKIEAFWTITSENNHNYYTLERSRNGVDFEKVSVIDAPSSTNTMIQYLETDNEPLKGMSYYRLKLTDHHNENTYSNSVMVNYTFGKKNSMNVSHNRANIADLKLYLKNEENAEILMVLRDANGNECYSKVIVAVENSEITGVDPENKLAAGTYIITATSNNLLYSQKLIVR